MNDDQIREQIEAIVDEGRFWDRDAAVVKLLALLAERGATTREPPKRYNIFYSDGEQMSWVDAKGAWVRWSDVANLFGEAPPGATGTAQTSTASRTQRPLSDGSKPTPKQAASSLLSAYRCALYDWAQEGAGTEVLATLNRVEAEVLERLANTLATPATTAGTQVGEEPGSDNTRGAGWYQLRTNEVAEEFAGNPKSLASYPSPAVAERSPQPAELRPRSRRDECFYIGDASTPEEVLQNHMRGGDTPADPRRSWWLIESTHLDSHVWWSGTGWTLDANGAARYSRRDACEREIEDQEKRGGHSPFGKATEHTWLEDHFGHSEYAGPAAPRRCKRCGSEGWEWISGDKGDFGCSRCTKREGGDTLAPEPETAQIAAALRRGLRDNEEQVTVRVTRQLLVLAGDRLEAQAARIAALESTLRLFAEHRWIPESFQDTARRALVGEEAP